MTTDRRKLRQGRKWGQRSITDEMIKVMIRRRRAGDPIKAIAADLKVSEASVCRLTSALTLRERDGLT